MIDADDPAIAPTLPQIQHQGQRVDSQRAVVSRHRDSPAVSNHSRDSTSPGPLSSHAITDDEGQGAGRKKAAPSRALKALQMAKAEVRPFSAQLISALMWPLPPGTKLYQEQFRR